MATRIEVLTLCDYDTDETTATDSIRFAWGGIEYVLDACPAHAVVLRDQLSELAQRARTLRVGYKGIKPRPVTLAAAPPPRTTETRERHRQIRKWAQDRGHAVNERGRIPLAVISLYDAWEASRVPSGTAAPNGSAPRAAASNGTARRSGAAKATPARTRSVSQ